MRKTAAATVVSFMSLAAGAEASVSYSYSASLPAYTVSAGSNIPVQINLVESFTGADTSLVASDGGLGGAAFQVTSSGSTGAAASIFSGVATGAGFDGFSNTSFDDGSAGLTESVFFLSPGILGTSSANMRIIPLGTVTISAGSLGNVTTFDVGPNTLVPRSTLTNTNFYDLDTTNNGGTPPPAYTGAVASSFTVTTVPEPSFALVGVVGCLLGLRRTRRAG